MRVLVCGGRNFCNRHLLDNYLDQSNISFLISGAQRKRLPTKEFIGADWLAIEWALKNQVPFAGYPAPWKNLGQAAGPWRNAMMFNLWQPEKIIAFPGDQGTRNMVTIAQAAGTPVEYAGW